MSTVIQAGSDRISVTDGIVSQPTKDATPDISFEDATMVPGFRDAHCHPVTYAASLVVPSLKTANDFADVGARLQAAAAGLPSNQPLSAIRLDDETLAEGRLPTRADLDAYLPDRPVIVHRYCGHIAIANSAALAAAGVNATTPNPFGGSLDRESDGSPSGVLREMAIGLVSEPLALRDGPAVSDDQLIAAMRGLASLGLTSIGGIVGSGDGPWADLGDQFEALLRVADRLPVKVRVMIIGRDPDHVRWAKEQIDAAASPRLTFLGVKMFGDGSLGGHTAAMHEPFADADTTGQMRLDTATARPMAKAALELGGMVAIHAIGDRANAAVLDLFATLIADGADPHKLRVEHASVLGSSEIEAFARLGVTASVQPAFLASETAWLEKRLGAGRLPWTYPFRTLLDAGVPLAGGSDCPVEPPHPLWGIAAARDRCGIVPEQGLTAAEALDLFTVGAAHALGEPRPLAPGSPADFLILDRDPTTCSPSELREASVLATFVDGTLVDVDRSATVWAG